MGIYDEGATKRILALILKFCLPNIHDKDCCYVDLKERIRKDGGNGSDFYEKVIDFDKIQEKLSNQQGKNIRGSIDIVFGIIVKDEIKIFLTEFKLKVKNPSNLRKNLKSKIRDTKNFFGKLWETRVNFNEIPVLVKREIIGEQTRNIISRINQELKSAKFSVQTEKQFYNKYFK